MTPRLFYFSSKSENTQRFMAGLGHEAVRIPIRADEAVPRPEAPFVLVCPTYCDGQGRGAVAPQVMRFLERPGTGELMRGIIASGNRNFGSTFALSGKVLSSLFDIPVLYRFELAGTPADLHRVRDGLDRFWRMTCSTMT